MRNDWNIGDLLESQLDVPDAEVLTHRVSDVVGFLCGLQVNCCAKIHDFRWGDAFLGCKERETNLLCGHPLHYDKLQTLVIVAHKVGLCSVSEYLLWISVLDDYLAPNKKLTHLDIAAAVGYGISQGEISEDVSQDVMQDAHECLPDFNHKTTPGEVVNMVRDKESEYQPVLQEVLGGLKRVYGDLS